MNLNFFYKPKKKPKADLDDDLLLPEDKKEIKKISQEKHKHLETVEELNHKIILIQNSSETLIPKFVRLHHNLRKKYRWYYEWHNKPYAKSVHWLVLLLYLISLPFVFSYLSVGIQKTKGATYDFPRWDWVNPTPTGENLFKVAACPGGASYWAVGRGGVIVKSTDANNWQEDYSGITAGLYDVKCLSASNIIAVGEDGTILQYDGISWTERSSGTTEQLYSLLAVDSSTVVAVGEEGKITVSTDGGQTWSLKESQTTAVLHALVAPTSSTVVAAGQWGKITVSTDSGQTWALKESQTTAFLRALVAPTTSTVVAVSDSGKITVSTDSGQTWALKESQTTYPLKSVVATSATNVVAVGGSGAVSIATVSVDGGQNWQLKATTGSYLDKVVALSSSILVTFGYTGNFLLSNDSGQTWNNYAFASYILDLAGNTSTAVAVGAAGRITVSTNAGQNWTEKSTAHPNATLNDIVKLDTNNFVAVGIATKITVSTDAGETWTEKTSQVMDNLYGVANLSSTTLVAVGALGQITVSTDAGQTWAAKTSGTSATLSSVTALDSTHAIAVGSGITQNITVSSDGGQTWTAQDCADGPMYKIIKIDATHAVASTAAGKFVLTADAGQTWSTKNSGSASIFNGLVALDTSNIIAVGDDGAISVSTDGGLTWGIKGAGVTPSDLKDVVALDANNLIAVGSDGTVLKSTNTGQTWSAKTSGTTDDLYSVAAPTSSRITAVGYQGIIISSSDGGQTWTTNMEGTEKYLGKVIAVNTTNLLAVGLDGAIIRYHFPANATATKLLIKLPGQSFADGVGVSGTPNSVKAGEQVTATVYAVDANNILDKGNASYAGFTTTDPNDTNPGNIQLTQGGTCVQNRTDPSQSNCGQGTVTFTFHTPGTWTTTAGDVYGVLSSGTSSSIIVSAGDPAKLTFTNFPSTLAAGAASSVITLNIKDIYGNQTTTGSSKTIGFSTTTSKGRFAQSASGSWYQGQMNLTIGAGGGSTTFYYLDLATGNPTITAAESPSAGWTDAQGTLAITAGQLSQSSFNLDKNSVLAGEEITGTVTLKNNEGVILSDKAVQLSASRESGQTITPSSANTNADGVATFTIQPTALGSFVLSAYDQSDNLYVPQDQTVNVSPGTLGKIVLESSASSINAGSAFNISVTLYDSYDNQLTNFNGEVHFASSDSEVSFKEKNHTFSTSENGKYTQSATLYSSGSQSITASSGNVSRTIYLTVEGVATPAPTPSVTRSVILTASPTPTEEPKSLIETFQESPIAQKIAKTLAPITAAVAALGLFPLLVQAFPQGFHALASLFPAIFTAAAARRRRKPWGIVYDSLTGKPIDLAVVRVFNDNNDRLVATKVTDQNGRFSFLLAKGKFYVKVSKAGYLFPPKISKLKAKQLATRFGPQADIYYGQPFVIGADDINLNLNIGLDPKISMLSTGIKLEMWLKNALDWFLIGLSYFAVPLMLIGAFFASIATVIIPSKFNLYMCGFYVLLLLAYLVSSQIRKTRLGLVFNSEKRSPVVGATVSIFDKEYSAIREIKTTDQNGHFGILAQKGQYYLTVHATGYKFPSKEFKFQKGDKKLGKLYFGETIKNKKAAFVNVSIPIDKD